MENQIEFYIPKNVSTRFEIIKGVGIREIIYTGVATIIGILVGIRLFTDYLKYKDETSEQRAERLKTEEMIKEWQKRYY